jgi:uncharacterized membrane protein
MFSGAFLYADAFLVHFYLCSLVPAFANENSRNGEEISRMINKITSIIYISIILSTS